MKDLPAILKPGAEAPQLLPETYISKAVLARRLNKSERTIENWQRKGIIPYTRLGRAVFYKWSRIEALMQSRPPETRGRKPQPTKKISLEGQCALQRELAGNRPPETKTKESK